MNHAELMGHMFRIYGRRNAVYLPGISDRVAFLMLGIRNLEDAVEENDVDAYGYNLASVFARTCAVAENFPDLDVSGAMASKYPLSGCSYCNGQIPCGCPREKRAPAKLVAPDPAQLKWTLFVYQSHLRRLYGSGNKEKGIDYALRHLFSEVGELITLQLILTPHTSQQEMYRQYALEIADTQARLIAVANLLEMDLEKAVLEQYEHGCKTCREKGGGTPCICGPFNTSLRKEVFANSVSG